MCRGGEEEGGSFRRRRSVFERGFLDIARGALVRREGLRATAVASEGHNSICVSHTPKTNLVAFLAHFLRRELFRAGGRWLHPLGFPCFARNCSLWFLPAALHCTSYFCCTTLSAVRASIEADADAARCVVSRRSAVSSVRSGAASAPQGRHSNASSSSIVPAAAADAAVVVAVVAVVAVGAVVALGVRVAL